MDRQAWIAVSLCVVGLVVWQVYMTQHAPRVPVPAVANAGPSPATESSAVPSAQPSAPAIPGTSPSTDVSAAPAPSAAPIESFEERVETLRNSDVELRLTNRGGAIREVHLLNHAAEGGKGEVILNSAEHLPIGAIVERPDDPAL